MDEKSPSDEFARLIKTIRACTMCNIPPPSYPIISGEIGARVMSVGQSPGVMECKTGRPFAGQAGRTLFGWLASAGITEDAFREGAYMTAVTKCYPAPDRHGRRDTPLPHEVINCAAYLVRELRLVAPRVIIPVGMMAVRRLIGDVKLDDSVGRVFELRYHSFDALVIPLPHPSGRSTWQYNPGNRKLLNKALERIAEHCGPLL